MAARAEADASGLRARAAALMDDEAAWDADDTDALLLGALEELERSGAAVARLADGGGNSLLHVAARWNRPGVMEALVRRGAELNAANASGLTPMDVAMHWGHAELAQQLRHYGGKHSCEAERDLAVAQRDLARRQARESAAERDHAAAALRQARHEREALRVERDRGEALQREAEARAEALQTRAERAEAEAATAARARDAALLRAEDLADRLAREAAARENALASWEAAEAFASERLRQAAASRERELEALAARDDALKERELAQALARQAHLDQGLATQSLRAAERERDKALAALLRAEREVSAEKESCRKQLARVDAERRGIQAEIDRQTRQLKTHNAKLERSARALSVAATRQQEELERAAMALAEARAEAQRAASARDDLAAACAALQQRGDALEDERRDAHRVLRERAEAQLRQQHAADAGSALGAVAATWRALQRCWQRLEPLAVTTEAEPASPDDGDGGQSPRAMLTRSSSCDARPRSTTALASSGSGSSLASAPTKPLSSAPKPIVLPFLRDSGGSLGPQDSPRTRAPSPLKPAGWSSEMTSIASSQLETPFSPEVAGKIAACLATIEAALRADESDVGPVVSNLLDLTAFIDSFLTVLADWVVDTIRLLRKQVDVQSKMIERKDELIQRFTHHRQESKKQAAAKFRECAVRPLL